MNERANEYLLKCEIILLARQLSNKKTFGLGDLIRSFFLPWIQLIWDFVLDFIFTPVLNTMLRRRLSGCLNRLNSLKLAPKFWFPFQIMFFFHLLSQLYRVHFQKWRGLCLFIFRIQINFPFLKLKCVLYH
jgi:hypothetical protein